MKALLKHIGGSPKVKAKLVVLAVVAGSIMAEFAIHGFILGVITGIVGTVVLEHATGNGFNQLAAEKSKATDKEKTEIA